MAKKDDKKDEEYEFQMPDFDEDAFIHKEMVGFRTTSILFVWGLIAALATWGILAARGDVLRFNFWPFFFLSLPLVAVFTYALKFIFPALKADIRHFGRREWLGTGFLFFFSWLAFTILLVNPPVSDYADPTADVYLSPSSQVEGDDIELFLFVADNYRIDSYTLTVLGAGETVLTAADLTEEAPGHYVATLSGLQQGSYTYVAEATDRKGNTNTTTGTFLVGDIVTVNLPPDGTLDGTDTILVSVDGMQPCSGSQQVLGGDCLRTVYLALADGTDLHLEYDATFGGWKATANFAGWTSGTNQFDVVVEQMNQFHAASIIEGGRIVIDTCNNGPCQVQVTSANGNYVTPVAPQVTVPPITVQTPGFELLAGIAILGGAAIMARRRPE